METSWGRPMVVNLLRKGALNYMVQRAIDRMLDPDAIRQEIDTLETAHDQPSRDYARQKAELEGALAESERAKALQAYETDRTEVEALVREHYEITGAIEAALGQLFALLGRERALLAVLNDRVPELNRQSVTLRLLQAPPLITREDWPARFMAEWRRLVRAVRW
jgi:hypothetical protein